MNAPFFLLYILLIGISYPIMRFMSLQFDPINNNAMRSLAGGLFLLALCAYKFRPQMQAYLTNIQALTQTLIIALFLAGNMYFFTLGLQKTSALSGSLFTVLSMPLAVLIAALAFSDERQRVLNKPFFFGTLLLLSGSFLFIFCKNESQATAELNIGYLYLCLAIGIQSVQNLFVKRLARQQHVIVMSAFIAAFTALINLLLACLQGSLGELASSSYTLISLLLLSGVYGMVAGMLAAFYIMQKHGIVTYNVLQLIVPIAAAIIGYFTLGETITLLQAAGALLVIMGGVIALQIKKSG